MSIFHLTLLRDGLVSSPYTRAPFLGWIVRYASFPYRLAEFVDQGRASTASPFLREIYSGRPHAIRLSFVFPLSVLFVTHQSWGFYFKPPLL